MQIWFIVCLFHIGKKVFWSVEVCQIVILSPVLYYMGWAQVVAMKVLWFLYILIVHSNF